MRANTPDPVFIAFVISPLLASYPQVQDRSQRALRLIRYAAPSNGSWSEPFPGAPPLLGTIVIEELANRWVNLHTCFCELSDGSLVWGSAHSGHFHLNRFSPTGRCEAALTSGDWIVDSLEAIDEQVRSATVTKAAQLLVVIAVLFSPSRCK